MQVILHFNRGTSWTVEERKIFLRDLRTTLVNSFRLPIDRISSEHPTGGDVILEVPDSLEPDQITQSLASFAEVLARQNGADVSFPISIPIWNFKVRIAGAA